jgi:hypothetical protein
MKITSKEIEAIKRIDGNHRTKKYNRNKNSLGGGKITMDRG